MNPNLKFVIVIVAGLLFYLPFSKSTFDQNGQAIPIDSTQRLTMLFVGDVMQHQTQIDAAYNPVTKTYEYDSCFNYVRSLISSYDIAIANLEVTLGGPPYTGYPQFSAPDNVPVALIHAGFDYIATANNHSCDRGRKGIERTIRILDSLGLPHTGTFKDSADRAQKYPLIIKKNGFKIALLNYTYGTNGIEVPSPTIVNLIDEKIVAADLKRAKDSLPDKIIVFTHWGDEYQSHPNAWQENMAKVYFDNGADIVIGSHPHVIQKMERYHYPDSSGREVMIVYSLGNYISNQRMRYQDGGATIGFELVKKNGKVEIGFAGYYFTWVWIKLIDGRKQFYIVPVSKYESAEGILDAESRVKFKTFITDSRQLYDSENLDIREITYDLKTDVWKTE
jgi:poly-gamma-glutamate capsule biosynthesis protein CapA/YwtB (metallophosphatase superfamily)